MDDLTCKYQSDEINPDFENYEGEFLKDLLERKKEEEIKELFIDIE